jgi:hypothetical protein
VLVLMGFCDSKSLALQYLSVPSFSLICNRIFMKADWRDRLSKFMNKKVTAKRMCFLQLTSA